MLYLWLLINLETFLKNYYPAHVYIHICLHVCIGMSRHEKRAKNTQRLWNARKGANKSQLWSTKNSFSLQPTPLALILSTMLPLLILYRAWASPQFLGGSCNMHVCLLFARHHSCSLEACLSPVCQASWQLIDAEFSWTSQCALAIWPPECPFVHINSHTLVYD